MKKEKIKDIIAGIISIIFIIVIFMLYFNNLYQNYFSESPAQIKQAYAITYTSVAASTIPSCKFILQPEREIIIRIDDVSPMSYFDIDKNMAELMIDRNISFTLGVIPDRIQNSADFRSWVQSLNDTNLVEIAQHGFNHTPNEFRDINYSSAKGDISAGKNIIETNLGVSPITFIPPYNAYSEDAVLALHSEGFVVMSAKQDQYFNDQNVYIVGYNASASDENVTYMLPSNIEKVVEDCGKSLAKTNLCVIMMHPQEYLNMTTKKLDTNEFTKFGELLDGLQELNAKFKTFKDLITCG